MGVTKAELTTSGDLKLEGNINTRLPSVIDGLIAHFPFDGIESSEGFKSLSYAYNNFLEQPRTSGTISNFSIVSDYINLQTTYYGVVTTPDSYTDVEVELDILTVDSSHVGIGFCNTNLTTTGDPQGYQWILRYPYSPPDNRIQKWSGTNQIYITNSTGPATPIEFTNNTWYRVKLKLQDRYLTTWMNGVKAIELDLTDTEFMSGGVSLVSYSGTIQFKNIHIRHIPSTTSNTVLTNDGIDISEATENLFVNPGFEDGDLNGWSEGASVSNYVIENSYSGRYSAKIIATADSSWGWLGQRITVAQNDVITISCYIKKFGEGNGRLALYEKNGSSYLSPHYLYIDSFPSEWTRYEFTSTMTNVDVNLVEARLQINDTTTGLGVLVDNFQLEKKDFSTSFVEGSKGAGSCALNIPTWGQEGTIYLEVASLYDTKVEDTGVGDRSFVRADTGSTTGFLFYLNDGDRLYNVWGSGTTVGPDGLNWKAFEFHSVALTFSKTNSRRRLFLDGNEVGSSTGWTTDYDWNSLELSKRQGGSGVGDYIIKNFSLYNRELSINEINNLYNSSFDLQTNGNLISKKVQTDHQGGWTKVYEGPAILVEDNSPNNFEIIDIYGDSYEFDEIMITAPYWDYQVKATTTETAKMKYSFKYYCSWLNSQPNDISPRIKFHGLDDIQDVGLTDETAMLFGYGNSWRRVTPVHYVSGSTAYMGTVPSYINYEEWGTYWGDSNLYYQSHHTENYPRESGTYQLTPIEFQTLEVFIKKSSDKTVALEQDKDGVYIQNNLLTGQTL